MSKVNDSMNIETISYFIIIQQFTRCSQSKYKRLKADAV